MPVTAPGSPAPAPEPNGPNEPAPVAAATPAQRRTRRAIVRSAVAVWSRDFTASLGDIADHAGVSRSTVHRYFADRDDLVQASGQHAVEMLSECYEQAAGDPETPIQLLESSIHASVQAADAVIYLFSDPTRFGDQVDVWGDHEGEESMLATIRAAQAGGFLNPDLPAEWLISHYYATIYTAAELVSTRALTPRAAANHAVTTWMYGAAAR